MQQGVDTGGHKAMKEGRSMSLSDGRVCDISYHSISALVGICYLKGYVVPQTRVHDKPYLVWISVYKNTGVIHKADCHCIAGLSGMCKHVAALLYKVADGVSLGSNKACTSSLQTWHQPRKRVRTSAFMMDINTPKASASMTAGVKVNRRDVFDPRPPHLRRNKTLADYDLDSLATLTNGNAAVLLYAAGFRDEQPIHMEPDISVLGDQMEISASDVIQIPTVTEVVSQYDEFDAIVQELSFTEASQMWLADYTTDQSSCALWYEQRRGRMTASTMGSAVSHVDANGAIRGATHSVVATIMCYYKPMEKGREPKSIKWGKENEPKALQMYELHQRKHPSLVVQKTGLWISQEEPYIAASPDALVQCKCCGKGCVEVKCPWSYRSSTISDFASDAKSFLHMQNGMPVLKRSHGYYTQTQVQMFCTGRDYCDFVTLTDSNSDNLHVTRIQRDPAFIELLIEKARIFWKEVILSEMRTKAVQMRLQQKQELET